jgi:hypothetical protein
MSDSPPQNVSVPCLGITGQMKTTLGYGGQGTKLSQNIKERDVKLHRACILAKAAVMLSFQHFKLNGTVVCS